MRPSTRPADVVGARGVAPRVHGGLDPLGDLGLDLKLGLFGLSVREIVQDTVSDGGIGGYYVSQVGLSAFRVVDLQKFLAVVEIRLGGFFPGGVGLVQGGEPVQQQQGGGASPAGAVSLE